MGWQDGRIIVSPGSQDDWKSARATLSGGREAVLDVVALLTMGYLDLLDRLPKGFTRLFVPQAVLDELNSTLAGNVLGGRPVGTIGKVGDFYVHKEITPEQFERGKKFIEKLREFVENSTEVVPAATVLDLARDRAETLRKILPECAIASVLVAKERSALLYSDDLGLRQIAKNEWQIEGVWSQAILKDLLERAVITKEEYHQAVKNLVLANYFFVTITHEDILWSLGQNGMDISREISRMFDTLHGPDCDETSAVALTADLIREVWLANILDHQRQMILDLSLNALTTNRLSGRVIPRLKIALASKFVLIPIHHTAVLQTIHLWNQQNLVRKGLVR
jgi:hypothetical protein